MIRLFWILKISLLYNLVNAHFLPKEVGPQIVMIDFTLKILEIIRRGVWVIFRVEREWVVGGYAH